jgi:hypothetical protein
MTGSGVALDRVVKVGKAQRIAEEKDGSIVADDAVRVNKNETRGVKV